MTTLGTLSIHLDEGPCRVGCAWCYLGARVEAAPRPGQLHLPVVGEALGRLAYDEVAVAVSEPIDRALPRLRAVVRAARAPVAVTTTPQLARRAPRALLDGVARLNLSIDSHKGVVAPDRVHELTTALAAAHPALEIVLIATLDSPAFAARLVDEGLLAALLALPAVDKIALNALKPPPPWCDRRFWMATLRRLQPLLAEHLEKRLFLDCYVAARLIGLGGCPGRANLSPAADGVAFRACVYQPAPSLVGGVEALAAAARDYTPPAACPFEIV